MSPLDKKILTILEAGSMSAEQITAAGASDGLRLTSVQAQLSGLFRRGRVTRVKVVGERKPFFYRYSLPASDAAAAG